MQRTDLYEACRLCPRKCGTNRHEQTGFCGFGDASAVASAVLHFGEEPPVSGEGGSGTIFFSGCPLGCPYCQNWQISQGEIKSAGLQNSILHNKITEKNPPFPDTHTKTYPTHHHKNVQTGYLGRTVNPDEFSRICLELQNRGAENINLVTGTHFIPSIRQGLELAQKAGLSIPIVWNTSGYERSEMLAVLDPLIDIYLTDVKTLDKGTASRFCGANNYPETAVEAVSWMMDKKALQFSETTQELEQGVIVRHLLFPGELKSTEQFLRWFSREAKDKALLSMMFQFEDPRSQGTAVWDESSYDRIMELLTELEIEEGFVQEAGDDSLWIPDFRRRNPFPREFARPVWHWDHGFIDP